MNDKSKSGDDECHRISSRPEKPGTKKLSRRDVLRHAGKAAYITPVLTVLALMPNSAAASIPPFPDSADESAESASGRTKSRTKSRRKKRKD